MKVTRRQFVKGGVAAFTVTFAAPEFLSRPRARAGRARAQPRRPLPERRQRLAQHARAVQRSVLLQPPADAWRSRPGNVLQIGTDSSKVALGLHPRLTGLKQIFDQGRLALIQRTGYPNQSRSHFQGTDIWSTANPRNSPGLGWLGRYLDTLPSPVDPLVGWNTTRELPHVLQAHHVAVPAISEPVAATRSRARTPAPRRQPSAPRRRGSPRTCRSTGRSSRSCTAARRRRSRRSIAWRRWRPTAGTATYPNNGFAQALQGGGRRDGEGIGTHVFYVHDRRLRHALRAERQRDQRRVLQPDGDAQRRSARVLQRPEEPGAARRHAGAVVLRVRPPHHRERQQRHRPRRGVA